MSSFLSEKLDKIKSDLHFFLKFVVAFLTSSTLDKHKQHDKILHAYVNYLVTHLVTHIVTTWLLLSLKLFAILYGSHMLQFFLQLVLWSFL